MNRGMVVSTRPVNGRVIPDAVASGREEDYSRRWKGLGLGGSAWVGLAADAAGLGSRISCAVQEVVGFVACAPAPSGAIRRHPARRARRSWGRASGWDRRRGSGRGGGSGRRGGRAVRRAWRGFRRWRSRLRGRRRARVRLICRCRGGGRGGRARVERLCAGLGGGGRGEGRGLPPGHWRGGVGEGKG